MPADAYQAVVDALKSWNARALEEVLGKLPNCDALTTAVSDYPNVVFEFATAAGGTVKLPVSAQVYLNAHEYYNSWGSRCSLGMKPTEDALGVAVWQDPVSRYRLVAAMVLL